MNKPVVLCERVVITGPDNTDCEYLVQYEDTDSAKASKESCLAYLRDCNYVITTEPHAVVGPGDDPAVSWEDLSDIIEPGDN